MISKSGKNLIFLLGLPRSGTTLLSTMLDQHPAIRCPPEPWIMLALESVGRTSAHNPADAPVLYRGFNEFCDRPTAIAAAKSYALTAYNSSLRKAGKAVLIDKTPRYYLILDYLRETFPEATFVILWRHPLDIAASMRTAWQVDVATQLETQQEHLICHDLVVGLRRLHTLAKAKSDRVYPLKYEDLVRKPLPVLNRLIKWIGLETYQEAPVLELAGSDFDSGSVGDKKVLNTHGPHQDSIDRWKQVFTPEQAAAIAGAIGPHLLSALGYSVPEGTDTDSAQSNAYAHRLELSLSQRSNEYQEVETYSDLVNQERKLLRLMRQIAPSAAVPQYHLARDFAMLADSVSTLFAQIADQKNRIANLVSAEATAVARWTEASQRFDHHVSLWADREVDLRSARDEKETALLTEQSRTANLMLQLQDLQRVLAAQGEDSAVQAKAIFSLSQQLEEAKVSLINTQAELSAAIEESNVLAVRLQQAQAEAFETHAALESERQSMASSNEIVRQELGQARREVERTKSEIESLALKLRTIKSRVDDHPPAGRPRRWPFIVPRPQLVPATLPGHKPWPKISIVTPSFNHAEFLEETILSVLNQNYPNLEYIVIDGGSTDASKAILEQYQDRLTYWISEPDRGQSHAINKGFARATGDLLGWVNSDDMLESGSLAAMAMAFAASGADMVAGACTLQHEGGIPSIHLTSCPTGELPLDELLDLERYWLRGRFFYQPEVMFTRQLWERAGGRLDESLYYSMDYELWLRFAEQRAKLHVTGRPTALYRVHEKQKTFRREDYSPELAEVRNRYRQRHLRTRDSQTTSADRSTERSHLRAVFFNDLGGAGGAGIAHHRLAAAMALAGHEAIPLGIAPDVCKCPLSTQDILQAITDRRPDIVFVGNIHSAGLDPAVVSAIAERWPTIAVLHDFYMLTGRCAYTNGCTKLVAGCDHTCPTPDEYPSLPPSQIRSAWQIKTSMLTGRTPPVLAGVSDWSSAFARQRFPNQSSNHGSPRMINIRYGLDTDLFRPRDKQLCREMLGLPDDRFIVLFSSSALSDKRKGLGSLLAALELSHIPDLLAVLIGSADIAPDHLPFDSISIGYIDDEHMLATLYSAADVFVGPSQVETFGQVFIESSACGTPTIAAATGGGAAEAVWDGVSGLLADSTAPEALAVVIRKLYDEPGLRRSLSLWGRLWVENEYSLRSAYRRMFVEMDSIGLNERLKIGPKITFLNDRPESIPVVYLWDSTEDWRVRLHDGYQGGQLKLARQAKFLRRENAGLAKQLADQATQSKTELQKLEALLIDLQSERDLLRQNLEAMESDRRVLQGKLRSLALHCDSVESELRSITTNSEMHLNDCRQVIARLEAEKAVLKQSIRQITDTRLWRAAAWVYPKYHKLTMILPVPLREWVRQAVGLLGPNRRNESNAAKSESEDNHRMTK
jgi:glycosyltransferase involved in cell wall biosynthesis